MRRLVVALSFSILIAMQTDAPMWVIIVASGILLLKCDKKERICILFILMLLLIRLNINVKSKPFTQGYITEINAHSFLVKNGMDHILVYTQDASKYHPFDRIAIVGEIAEIEARKGDFGFDVQKWASANRILGTISDEQTLRFCRSSIGHFILSGGFAKHNAAFVAVFRDLIYDTEPDDPLLDFISLGLQFTLLLSILNRLAQHIPNENAGVIFQFIGLVLFAGLFGFPLTALRFIFFFLTSRCFKDSKLAFSTNILCFFFYAPSSLSQWTILIPLAFQFTTIFYRDKYAYFVRCVLLSVIFMRSNGIFLPLSILLFPLARKILMIISAVFWLATLLPCFAYPALFLHGIFVNLQNMITFDHIGIIGTISNLTLIMITLLFLLFPHRVLFRWIFVGILLASPLFIYLNPFPQVVFLNAGQGDAMLIRSAYAACTIVMDTGPPKEETNIIGTLRSKTVDHIDALILTHADADHSGNLDAFESAFEINKVITQKQDVVCPGLMMKNLDVGILFEDANADSLLYATSLNQTSFLFMADADVNTEAKLLQRYDLNTDIVKLGHHGSQSASSNELIGNIQAKLAIISVGKNNYGHPHASVLQRLNDFRLKYLSTRSVGDITVTMFPGFALVTSRDFPIRLIATSR